MKLEDFMDKDLFLTFYDNKWRIAEFLLEMPEKLRIINRATVKSVTYADGRKLESNHYFLKLDGIIYLTEKEIDLYGRIRKYDPKTKTVDVTQEDVVMKLEKILEDETPRDL